MFDSPVYRVTEIPVFTWFFPKFFKRKFLRLYTRILVEVSGIQFYIHDISYEDAIAMRTTFLKILKLLSSINTEENSGRNKEQLYSTIGKIIQKLNENVFLLTLIVDKELAPTDKLNDLLEDYYDGLAMDLKEKDESVLWDDLKKELDIKHAVPDV